MAVAGNTGYAPAMAGSLTREQVAGFRRDGFVSPLDALTEAEAAAAVACLERYERETGERAMATLAHKSHLPFRLFSDIVRHPCILDAVEDLIGPDILCWGSSFFVKEARDPGYVSWHCDTYYYGIEPRETVTAWVAFTPSDRESGCIRCIPGSHLAETAFDEAPDGENLLTRGQTTRDVDAARAVHMPLAAGQFSIHHECTVHSSEPNRADYRRIGLSIHYCPTHARQTRYAERPTAALVRGADRFGHWAPEPRTEIEFDAEAAARMKAIRDGFIGRGRD